MLADQVLAALRAAVSASPSQSQLARDIKLSQGTINDYLNGRRSPGNMTLDTFERLMPRLGLCVAPVGRACSRCSSLSAAALDLAARIDALTESQRFTIVGRLEVYEEQQNPPRPASARQKAGA